MTNEQQEPSKSWAVMIYPSDKPGEITYAHPGLTQRQVLELLRGVAEDCERAIVGEGEQAIEPAGTEA